MTVAGIVDSRCKKIEYVLVLHGLTCDTLAHAVEIPIGIAHRSFSKTSSIFTDRISMSKSLSEFKRFIGKSIPTFTEHEKKLVRLILDNFPKVELAGTAAGKRGKLIAQLIETAGDTASSELNIAAEAAKNEQGKIVRVSSIKVQNFRGFSTEHTLEFKNPYTFVYGPNGTGKSSLCEALEYGLLGYINALRFRFIDANNSDFCRFQIQFNPLRMNSDFFTKMPRFEVC